MPDRAGDIAVALLAALLLLTLAPRFGEPPLEGHSWRQTLAASVARSYRCGQPFLRPRVDACGRAPEGIQAMELPAYAYAMAGLGGLAGPHRGERIVAFLGALLALVGIAATAR